MIPHDARQVWHLRGLLLDLSTHLRSHNDLEISMSDRISLGQRQRECPPGLAGPATQSGSTTHAQGAAFQMRTCERIVGPACGSRLLMMQETLFSCLIRYL